MANDESVRSGESNTVAFGPDIVFVPKGTEPCEFWAEISATDDSGVSVDKLEEGDELRIIEISGACSFAKGKSGLILSIIAAAADAALGGAGAAAWKTAVSSMRKDLDKHMADGGGDDNDGGGGKKRDGYGQEVGGGGNYAQKEGGVIVCLPRAGGVVYSSEKIRRAKGGGGSSAGGGWFFPTRKDAGKTWVMGFDGVLRIAAFDSNYGDNAGSYEVKFSIRRPQ